MKKPSFSFYPTDFWGSPDVLAMDLHEVAAYLSLLSAAWSGERYGCLPDDDDRLRRWARMTRDQWEQSRSTLLRKFPVAEVGWRVNARLLHEARKSEAYSASQSAKGKLGGRPKATEKPRLLAENPELVSGISPEKPSVSASVSASTKERKTTTKATVFVLPDWIDRESWQGFEQMRRIRKPLTNRARLMIVGVLAKLRDEGYDATECLDRSTMNGWTSVYPPQSQSNSSQKAQPTIRYSDPEAQNAR